MGKSASLSLRGIFKFLSQKKFVLWFFVFKHIFGADLKSWLFQNQKKKISCKIIRVNIDRFIQFVMIEVFY
jgi:hypothetical protein